MVSIKFQLELMKGIGFGFVIEGGMLTIHFLILRLTIFPRGDEWFDFVNGWKK